MNRMIINYNKKLQQVVIKFASKHNAKLIWTVTVSKDEVTICDCLTFSRYKTCWHIDQSKTILENAFNAANHVLSVEKHAINQLTKNTFYESIPINT